MTTTTTNNATEYDKLQEIGKSSYESIAAMVAASGVDFCRLEELRDTPAEDLDDDERDELQELEEAAGDCIDEDEARQRITDDPLSLQVRSGWESPGESLTATEYEILLSTGGPATRIVGDLSEHKEPISATLQAQDWSTAWTAYGEADEDTLRAYADHFFFGE